MDAVREHREGIEGTERNSACRPRMATVWGPSDDLDTAVRYPQNSRMTTIRLEFCRDRRRICRQLGQIISDRCSTDDIDLLLTRVAEEIKCQLQQTANDVAVVMHAVPQMTSLQHRESTSGTHMTAAVAMVQAPLSEARIRWTAEAVAASNRLYIRPRRSNPIH